MDDEKGGVGSLSPHGGCGGLGGGVELQAHEAGDDEERSEERGGYRLLLSLVFCKPWPAAPWFAACLEERVKSVSGGV
jgi:hypothetical protein